MIKNEAKTLTLVNHPDFDGPGPDILGNFLLPTGTLLGSKHLKTSYDKGS